MDNVQQVINKNEQKLGFWLSTSLVVGNMTGSGIFLLPAALAVYGGISIFGWIFTAFGAVLLALVFSRLSRLISKAGGPYAYSKEGFGDFIGFLVVWGYWISIWCGNAAIAVAGVGYLTIFFPSLKEDYLLSAVTAIVTIWLFSFINTKNIRSVGKVQLVITILKILPLLLFGTLGFLYFNVDHFLPLNISDSSNFNAILASAALTLWAFLGLESTTIPSDKVINPKKNHTESHNCRYFNCGSNLYFKHGRTYGYYCTIQAAELCCSFCRCSTIALGQWIFLFGSDWSHYCMFWGSKWMDPAPGPTTIGGSKR